MTTTSIALLVIAGASIGFAIFCCIMYFIDYYKRTLHKRIKV